MLETAKDNQVLLTKIREKRKELAIYLSRTEPRNIRLINSSIIAGALAAALTAGPGVGGEGFIGAAKDVVSFGIPVWQMLCLIATVLSVSAVIANGMLKSHGFSAKVARTRACDAKLEGLETMLELDQVDVKQATQVYTQCLTEISHI
ncbi:hypothetical protein OKW21_006220 [Catalinimonas alkaloidigena]|uniref:hypothetical protein n=1 Tax=Catalinimonas alkaloidigena TaxID=1075417 RepID=UPI0024057495|nr:hypothetical protein [Catalinimonas alkaloidigena]MDF9800957.1 hypothetical protein [Catalinimonas alkaloidigena]